VLAIGLFAEISAVLQPHPQGFKRRGTDRVERKRCAGRVSMQRTVNPTSRRPENIHSDSGQASKPTSSMPSRHGISECWIESGSLSVFPNQIFALR
jgi:hypothetical protein